MSLNWDTGEEEDDFDSGEVFDEGISEDNFFDEVTPPAASSGGSMSNAANSLSSLANSQRSMSTTQPVVADQLNQQGIPGAPASNEVFPNSQNPEQEGKKEHKLATFAWVLILIGVLVVIIVAFTLRDNFMSKGDSSTEGSSETQTQIVDSEENSVLAQEKANAQQLQNGNSETVGETLGTDTTTSTDTEEETTEQANEVSSLTSNNGVVERSVTQNEAMVEEAEFVGTVVQKNVYRVGNQLQYEIVISVKIADKPQSLFFNPTKNTFDSVEMGSSLNVSLGLTDTKAVSILGVSK